MRKFSILCLLALIACAPDSAMSTVTPTASTMPQASATTGTPMLEPALLLPYATLVDDTQPGIALVGADGQTLLAFNAPSEASFQAGSAHLAGSFSGQGFPPLVYLALLEGHKTIVVNQFNGLHAYQASDFLFQFAGAPAQPILAVSEAIWLKGNDVQNNIFFGTLEELRRDPSSNVILVEDDGMAYAPVAVTSQNGVPLGFFFTKSSKGAQDLDDLFPARRGLHYFDFASSTLPQIMADERLFCGLSPSLALYASTNVQYRDLRIQDTGRSSYRSLGLETSSDLGTGYVVFSPDDQTVGWMEAGTDEDSTTGYRTLIKIAGINVKTLHILPSASFDRLVGVTSIRVTPAGFINDETLLVQVTTEDGQDWLASVDVPSGDITIFHAGTFLAFVYP